MLTLPPVLGSLSKLVGKPQGNNSARFPTTVGVCVGATPDGWEAAATDFNRMILATGPHPDPKPDYATLADAPNGATVGSLPPKWWADVFGQAKKLRGHPGVGLVLSNSVATASPDGYAATQTNTIQGRIAPFGEIIPKRTSDIGCVIRFDANLMAGLLKSIADLSDPADLPVVTMEIRRPANSKSQDKPFVLRADYPAQGMTAVTGMLQPCAAKGDENGQSTTFFAPDSRADENQPAPTEDPTADRAEVERLRVALAGAEQGHVQQANVIRILEEQIEEQAGHYRTLADTYDHVKAENTRLRDDVPDADELIGLWGKLGAKEDQLRDSITESERLREELVALRRQLDAADLALTELRGEVQRTRALANLPTRRTLGQLAAVRKGE